MFILRWSDLASVFCFTFLHLVALGTWVVYSVNWLYCNEFITKTCLYNFDLLKPHFYIVKLGFAGVYIIFHISAQKCRLWVPVSRRGGSNEYLQSMVWAEKYQNFYLNFHFLVVNFSHTWKRLTQRFNTQYFFYYFVLLVLCALYFYMCFL